MLSLLPHQFPSAVPFPTQIHQFLSSMNGSTTRTMTIPPPSKVRRQIEFHQPNKMSSQELELRYLPEPELMFGFDQRMEDPRDGLTLFGPLDKGKPIGIRTGVVGTENGCALFRRWLEAISHPIFSVDELPHRPDFLGFEETFQTRFLREPSLICTLRNNDLISSLYEEDK